MAKKQIIFTTIELIIILLFLFFIGSGMVVSPVFGDVNVIDEGQFGAWIRHLLSGEYLYKDTYAAYGPFYIYPLYFLAQIFTPTVFLIRIYHSVINVFLAILIVITILREIKTTRILEVFIISLLLIIPGTGMRQGIGLLTIFLIYKSIAKNNLIWSILAGISFALSILISIDTGIFIAIIWLIFIIWNSIKVEKINIFLKKIFSSALSLGASLILFYFWSSGEGWFYAYINSIITDLTVYSGIALPNGQNFPNALHLLPQSFSIYNWIKYIFSKEILLYWLFFIYIISFIYFIIKLILKKFENEDAFIFLITIFGFLLSTILIGRYGHFTYTLSPVYILFAYFLKKLIYLLRSSKIITEKIFSIILILIIFSFSIRLISIYRPHFAKILNIPSAIFSEKYPIEYLGPVYISKSQAESFTTIQSFIKSNTTIDDRIFFLNNEPIMYLMVNRDNPTRYDIPAVPNILEKRYEVLNDLIKKPPKYIIYDRDAWPVDEISNLKRLPEVSDYINYNYKKKMIKNFIIYYKK